MGAFPIIRKRIMDKSSYSEILGNFGVPKSTLTYFLNVILLPLKCSSIKHLWDIMDVGKITNRIVREVIEKIFVKKKRGNKTYLIKDKESYIVATSEIDGSHGLPRYNHNLNEKLQQVLHEIGAGIICNCITPLSEQRYARILIQRVNRN